MTDRYAKTRPWRVMVNRNVTVSIGHLTVKNMVTGNETVIDRAPTEMEVTAGERMFRTKRDASAFVESYRRDHGADIVSDVYRAA